MSSSPARVRIDFNRLFGTIQFINLSRVSYRELSYALFVACNSFFVNFFDQEEDIDNHELLSFMRAFLFFLPLVSNLQQRCSHFEGRNFDSDHIPRRAFRLQHFPTMGRKGSTWGLHLPQNAAPYRTHLHRAASSDLAERVVRQSFPHAISGGWAACWINLFARRVEEMGIPDVGVVHMGRSSAILLDNLANHLYRPRFDFQPFSAYFCYRISSDLIRFGGMGFAQDFCYIANVDFISAYPSHSWHLESDPDEEEDDEGDW
ncbi:putative RNA silencing suppressor protein [Groundnut rosette assistor virus]|uniref:RNA silencing suppressor protein n=1 Tax=Groundnut rosette assistor virus TaxID=33761 RepID=A0AAE6R3M3_9VIRU|nr:putative RNA silencing suppressor protein [Groundnut rosette assistor virus]QGY99241.1 putative RNA silencing suppressor protein [Groundnut rosette assistor virus]